MRGAGTDNPGDPGSPDDPTGVKNPTEVSASPIIRGWRPPLIGAIGEGERDR